MKVALLSVGAGLLLTLAACSADNAGDGAETEDNLTGGKQAAGFDFDGFRVAPLSVDETCPTTADPVGDACRLAGGTRMTVKSCKALCSVPIADKGKVAGFAFDGFHIAEGLGNAGCAAVLDPVGPACMRVPARTVMMKGCKLLCAVPVADDGKVAGYDFTGPQILAAPKSGMACPAVVAPEADACRAAKGRAIAAAECKTLCSVPIVKN